MNFPNANADQCIFEMISEYEEPEGINESTGIDLSEKKPRRISAKKSKDGRKSKTSRRSVSSVPEAANDASLKSIETLNDLKSKMAVVESPKQSKMAVVELPKLEREADVSDNKITSSPRQYISIPTAVISVPQFKHPSLSDLTSQVQLISGESKAEESPSKGEEVPQVVQEKLLVEINIQNALAQAEELEDHSQSIQEEKHVEELDEVPPFGEDHTSKNIALDETLADRLNQVADKVSWGHIQKCEGKSSSLNILQVLDGLNGKLRYIIFQ